jgi:hypothetical protein
VLLILSRNPVEHPLEGPVDRHARASDPGTRPQGHKTRSRCDAQDALGRIGVLAVRCQDSGDSSSVSPTRKKVFLVDRIEVPVDEVVTGVHLARVAEAAAEVQVAMVDPRVDHGHGDTAPIEHRQMGLRDANQRTSLHGLQTVDRLH